MKRYVDRKREKVEEYRVGSLVLLSTKDLKYQMARKHIEKFTEYFVEPYKVKAIISSNTIELELSSIVKIHPVVNVSSVRNGHPSNSGRWLPTLSQSRQRELVRVPVN